ncbi:MAG: leucine-rich repeat domain-containing protein, partial [Paramuribaculum sp.]|nr:leucine-rich repeat domain-containing protein [Paramuribaculum sp.]
KLYQLDIPDGVYFYGLNALNYSQDLTLLVLRNPEVIPVSWCVLEGTNRSNGALFVPEGARESFSSDIEWGQFGLIVEGDRIDDWAAESDDTYSYSGIYPEVVITKVNNPVEKMTIPETVEIHGRNYNVTGIGERVFQSSVIQKIHIPKSIVKIGEFAITSDCGSLTEIEVDENNPVYFSHEGVLYNDITNTLIVYPTAKRDKVYDVPEGVMNIYGWACYNDFIEKITFPSTMEYIGACAFCYSGLQYKNYPVIISKAEIPPYLDQSAFNNEVYPIAEVYVPANSLETYKADNKWSKFSKIFSLDEYNAVNKINSDDSMIFISGNTLTSNSEFPVEIYSIDGKLLNNSPLNSIALPSGLYVIKINGQTRKIKIGR